MIRYRAPSEAPGTPGEFSDVQIGLSQWSRRARLDHIEQIIASPTLHGSDSVCKVLRYLAQQTLDDPTNSAKEHQIAHEALGRGPDFDPRIDSVVRVTVARLRQKLEEYYAQEGRHDPIRVQVPKGAYTVTFEPARIGRRGHPTRAKRLWTRVSAVARRRWLMAVSLALLATAFTAAGAYLLGPGARASLPVPAGAEPSSAFQVLWGPFLEAPEKPMVVYSNARFVGRASTGLRYFRPGQDPPASMLDHYTGIGEVMAVHDLTRLFTARGRDIEVKRGQLLNWDDARKTNLIFVGAPSENLPLRELPRFGELHFQDGVLVNPRTPEPQRRMGRTASREYAMIRLTEGLAPRFRVLVLAGITTLGTQAAVEFVCQADKLEELFHSLGLHPEREAAAPPFEAAVEVVIGGGVPIETKLVAAHLLTAAP